MLLRPPHDTFFMSELSPIKRGERTIYISLPSGALIIVPDPVNVHRLMNSGDQTSVSFLPLTFQFRRHWNCRTFYHTFLIAFFWQLIHDATLYENSCSATTQQQINKDPRLFADITRRVAELRLLLSKVISFWERSCDEVTDLAILLEIKTLSFNFR